MASDSDSLVARVRAIADELESEAMQPVAPDVSVVEAVRRLRKAFRKGKLSFEVSWNDYKSEVEIEYAVRDSGYKALATDESLANVVRKALVAHAPNDTLDKLDAAMGPPVEAAVPSG